MRLPLFVLLYDEEAASGRAVPCELARFAADADAPLVTEINVASPHLARAAERGAWLALTLLRREGYRRESLEVHFTLPESLPAVTGESAGLLFALGVVARTLRLQQPAAIAATGVLDEGGRVQRVRGLAEKISAALDVLPSGSLLFYPWVNSADVPATLLAQAKRQGVTLDPVERLDQAVAHLGVTIRKLYVDTPYQGFEAFSHSHAGIFFGRGQETQELLKLLKERREGQRAAVLVIGSSGSGKSSLVQAGLLPTLLADPQQQCRFAIFRPRQLLPRMPLKACLQSIWQQAEALGPKCHLPMTINGAEHARHLLTQRPQTHWILVVDQLEEVFTAPWTDARRRGFSCYLNGLLQGSVSLIGTLRADLMERFVTSPLWQTFTDSFHGGQYTLPMPGPSQLAAIVREPAQQADLEFEKRHGIGLDDHLLEEAKGVGDVLPLLELTLTRLHAKRTDEGRLTYAAYEAIGGLKGVVAHLAEEVFTAFSGDQDTWPAHHRATEQLPTLRRIFRKLLADQALDRVLFQLIEPSTEPGRETARAALLDRFPARTMERDLVDALTEARLLILDQQGDAVSVRVAHEALFNHWDRVRELVAQNRADLALRKQLNSELDEWIGAGRPSTWDFPRQSGKRLSEAADFLQRRKEELETEPELQQYLRATIAHARRRERRKRRLLSSIAVAMTVLALAAGWQWYLANQRGIALEASLAESQRSTALAIARQAEQAFRYGDLSLARDLLKTVHTDYRSWEWRLLASLVGPSPRLIKPAMLQVPPETIRVLLQLPNIRVPHYVHPTLWLPSAMKLEFSQWAQLYSEEDPSDVDNLIEGSFGYRAAQYGQLRSQWIAEDCGACEQFGLIERTDPTTTLGGFRRINRGQVPLFTPSRDGSVGFLQLQQLPDRPGTTLDGDKLAGSGNFVLPLRNRVQLVGDPPPIPQDQEQCDPIQNGESKAALCLSVQAYRRDTSETTEVQVKQLTDSTAYVETLSGPSEGFDSPRVPILHIRSTF